MKKMKEAQNQWRQVQGPSSGENTAYTSWIADLKKRWRATQIKAAVAVNSALIEFYWKLGRDISEKYPGKKRNLSFFATLSKDLRLGVADIKGLSERNIRYSLAFYELYSYLPQVVANSGHGNYRQQVVDDTTLQQLVAELVLVPWGHHRTIIDKCKGDRDKALALVEDGVKDIQIWAGLMRGRGTEMRRDATSDSRRPTTGCRMSVVECRPLIERSLA